MMSKDKAPIANPTIKRRLNRIKISNQLFIKLETMFKLIDLGQGKPMPIEGEGALLFQQETALRSPVRYSYASATQNIQRNS